MADTPLTPIEIGLTAAIVAVQHRKGLAPAISYADITKGGTVRDDTKTVTITIHGVNDAPVLTASASGSVTEDDSNPTLTTSGALSFTDVDTNDTHTVGSAYNGNAVWSGGTLNAGQIAAVTSGFSATASGWNYNVANSAVQFLAVGETITLSYNVTVTDSSGGPSKQGSGAVSTAGSHGQPWYTPGRKLLFHSAGPTTGLPGHITTNQGRFWFSVPRP